MALVAGCVISEVAVSPAIQNNGFFQLSCVIRDSVSGAVLATGVTGTVIIYRSDMTEIAGSPLTLYASGGKYIATLVMTTAMPPGHYTYRVVALVNVTMYDQKTGNFDVVGYAMSASQYAS